MLEQPLPMSSALRARARSLGFLMGYSNNNINDVVYNLQIIQTESNSDMYNL